MNDIRLTEDDRTVFAKCVPCDKRGARCPQGTYYGASFTKRKWERGPACENCEGPLTKLYEVRLD